MSRYYVHVFFQNFILRFMSLLTAPIVSRILAGNYLIFLKNCPGLNLSYNCYSHVLAGIDLIFQKNTLDQTWRSFKIEFGPRQKYWKKSYQVRKDLALFRNLVTLILGCYCVKGLMIAKIIKGIGFERARGKLGAKNCFLSSRKNHFYLRISWTIKQNKDRKSAHCIAILYFKNCLVSCDYILI